jgi:hypothetical protein
LKIQEVILRALSGEIHWFQAAEILGVSTRTMRRYRWGLDTGNAWMGGGRFTGARSCSAAMNLTASLWTQPVLWKTANDRGFPQGPWIAGKRPPATHSAHRPHLRRIYSESGQITC